MTIQESLSVAVLVALCQPGVAQHPGALRIVTLEGEGAFNNIKTRQARSPVVQVVDERGSSVAGAQVTFLLPALGAGATFVNGSQSFTTATDNQGRAAAPELKPNSTEGRFNIKVTASLNGRSETAIISQSNTLAGGAITTSDSGSGGKKFAVLLAIAGGAAGGIYAATRGGASGGASTGAPPTSLSTGAISVGGPR